MQLLDIRLIEIEIHSFCNRRCEWCPNKFIDRLNKVEMEESVYLSVLKSLKDIDYSGCITFSRYNEPLSDIGLLQKRIKQLREYVPNAKVVTNTNGDYLNDLDSLTMIDELTIMDYDNRGDEFVISKLKELGADITNISKSGITAKYKTLNILYHNFWDSSNINNRGGSLDVESSARNKPCYEPSRFIGIDYNGKITPCCNIRSDYHNEKFILGDLTNDSLFDIMNSEKANKFRDDVLNCRFPKPCISCSKEEGRYTCDSPSISY